MSVRDKGSMRAERHPFIVARGEGSFAHLEALARTVGYDAFPLLKRHLSGNHLCRAREICSVNTPCSRHPEVRGKGAIPAAERRLVPQLNALHVKWCSEARQLSIEAVDKLFEQELTLCL